MKKLCFLIVLFFISVCYCNAQNTDMSIEINESTINKVLTTVGVISGENTYETFMFSGTYKWHIINPQIKLTDNKALFVADIQVETGTFQYTDNVQGEIIITYNEQTNKIVLKLANSFYEIYTKILGQKIVLKKIDLADAMKDPIQFDGPVNYQTVFPFAMPDSTVKKIIARVKKCVIKIIPQKIILNTELEFTEMKY